MHGITGESSLMVPIQMVPILLMQKPQAVLPGEINGAVIGELNQPSSGVHVSNIVEALQAASMPEASLVWQMYRQLPRLAIRKIQIYWHRF